MQRGRPLIVPPIVRAGTRRLTALSVLLAVPLMGLLVGGLMAGYFGPARVNLAMRVVAVWATVILALGLREAISLRRLVARAARRGDALCVHCGYLLAGLDEAGVCPECSKPFLLAEARALWANARLGPTKRRPWAPPDGQG
jgi:hypothetical protein